MVLIDKSLIVYNVICLLVIRLSILVLRLSVYWLVRCLLFKVLWLLLWSLSISITDVTTSFVLSVLCPVISKYFYMSSLNGVTNLSNLLPLILCSSFATRVSNLISIHQSRKSLKDFHVVILPSINTEIIFFISNIWVFHITMKCDSNSVSPNLLYESR